MEGTRPASSGFYCHGSYRVLAPQEIWRYSPRDPGSDTFDLTKDLGTCMERELPPYRRTFAHRGRSSIWTILALGALLAIAITAAAQLLSKTRERWEARNAPSAPAAPQPTLDDVRAARLAEIRDRRERAATDQAARQQDGHQYRCINGQLFRRLPNGWENLPGEHCQ